MASPKRYTILTGKFYLRFDERRQNEQPQPDGDTIRFVPDNPYPFFDSGTIKRYGSVGPDLSNYGINVRLEGVDALETHFARAGSPVTHQNLTLANKARDVLLSNLGFTNIKFTGNTVKSASNNPVTGYVIANGVEQNGRLLGLIYAGTPDGIPEYDTWKNSLPNPPVPTSRPQLPHAIPVFVDTVLLAKSVNWTLIDAGLAYAELYTSMPLDLVRHIARRVRELRKAPPPNSIWANETLALGTTFVWDKKIDSLSNSVIFPKLFRRLVEYGQYFKTARAGNRDGFMVWLRKGRDRDDRLLLPPAPGTNDPPSCEFGNLHDLIKVESEGDSLKLSLNYHPEDVIVLPDNV